MPKKGNFYSSLNIKDITDLIRDMQKEYLKFLITKI